ncbi:MAG TPA: hypothetical protein VLN42_13525, partial [Casimicrobiaceae bacterium]|nr:hypothetical protein [Casimicrobiaceae bacterium]
MTSPANEGTNTRLPRVAPMRRTSPAASTPEAIEPLFDSIWPFLAIVIVLVALAFIDFLLVQPAPSARITLLALRLASSAALLILAGLTLRRLFAQRARLQQALRASEERLVSSLSDIQM